MTSASVHHRVGHWLARQPEARTDRVRRWMSPRLRAQLREEAMVESDVRAIEHALSDVRVLSHDVLAHRCGAAHWQPGHFHRALQRALNEGRIHRVGSDFYGLGPQPTTSTPPTTATANAGPSNEAAPGDHPAAG